MPSVFKEKRLTVRFSALELADLKRAARIETKLRQERVEESTLVRELAMPRIREILAEADKKAA